MPMSENYTYILRCADGSLYTGWTNDLGRRLAAHNAGRGAKYTRARRPVELVYAEGYETKAEAMRRETAIKRLPRAMKLCLAERGISEELKKELRRGKERAECGETE